MIRIFIFLVTLFSSLLQAADPKICLAMVIKNDDAYIWRCLNSVRSIIDCVCVCNADAVGNYTLLALNEFVEEHQLPTKIFKHHWESEAYNQTLIVKKAQEAIKSFGFSLENTYILLLDPNQTIEISADFKKQNLQGDSSLVLEKLFSPLFSQYSPNFFRASLPWKYTGPIYGSWNTHGSQVRISSLKINTEEPYQKYKTAKLENDLETLSNLIKIESKRTNKQKNLAQTQRALNHYEEAISFYQQ